MKEVNLLITFLVPYHPCAQPTKYWYGKLHFMHWCNLPLIFPLWYRYQQNRICQNLTCDLGLVA